MLPVTPLVRPGDRIRTCTFPGPKPGAFIQIWPHPEIMGQESNDLSSLELQSSANPSQLPAQKYPTGHDPAISGLASRYVASYTTDT